MNPEPNNNQIENEKNLSQIIDANLDKLESKINELNSPDNFYSYEVSESGALNIIVDGNKLDIDYRDPEKLIQALKSVSHILNTYKNAGHKGKLYAKESMDSKGDHVGASYIDLYVDNRVLLPDTTFLTKESMRNIFSINDTRDNMSGTQNLANFLNKIVKI